MSTFIIAEAGANHNRDWKIAKKLVYAAAASGADAVKFQSYTSSKLYVKETPDFGAYKDIPKLISSIELPKGWDSDIKKLCDDCGIEFMSTPFDENAVESLYKIGVKRMKIASFEANDSRLVKCIASTKLPLIFSAGIGSGLDQIKKVLETIYETNDSADVTVLHCNSSYPTPIKDINLGQISLIKKQFGDRVNVGLSDHTFGILIPPVAVAMGAETIEKHYTLSRDMPGPDHPFAIEPDELHTMCKNIRDVEKALGTKRENCLTESELKNEMGFARRSVVSSRRIKAGEQLTIENTTTKRPYLEGNVSAESYFEVTNGHFAQVDIEEDQMIKWNEIQGKK